MNRRRKEKKPGSLKLVSQQDWINFFFERTWEDKPKEKLLIVTVAVKLETCSGGNTAQHMHRGQGERGEETSVNEDGQSARKNNFFFGIDSFS